MKVEMLSSCGRCFLSVNGIAVAMEGDKCRDPDVIQRAVCNGFVVDDSGRIIWTDETIKAAIELIEEAEVQNAI